MTSIPAVSVVIPSYNQPPAFLRECLRSVQGQTFENWEAIVVDDASTVRHAEKVDRGARGLHGSGFSVTLGIEVKEQHATRASRPREINSSRHSTLTTAGRPTIWLPRSTHSVANPMRTG